MTRTQARSPAITAGMPQPYSDWCKDRGIKRQLGAAMLLQGIAPRVMLIGSRRFVTREASLEWEKQMEARAEAQLREQIERHAARHIAQPGKTSSMRSAE